MHSHRGDDAREGRDIARCRDMISRLIRVLERYVERMDGAGEEDGEPWPLGARETVLTALGKLVQLLERVAELETQWRDRRERGGERENASLSAEEWDILARYMKKRSTE